MTAMYRVQQVLTGVPGAPYYLTGYFAADGGTAQGAADAWAGFVRNDASAMPPGSRHNQIAEVELVESTTGQTTGTEAVDVAAVDGTGTDEYLPLATQGLCRWRTNTFLNGREIRGRTNLPIIPEGDSDTGRPSVAYVAAINARAALLVADVDSTHVVYSRKNGTVAVTQTGSCWTEWAVLRSRRD